MEDRWEATLTKNSARPWMCSMGVPWANSKGRRTGADHPFPLWISEMGVGPMDQPVFLENLCRYIQERDLSWAWWPLNTGLKPDSEEMETWGLVNEKWDQPLDDWRLPVIQQLMQ